MSSSDKSPENVMPLKLAGEAVPADVAIERAATEVTAFLEQLDEAGRAATIGLLAKTVRVETVKLVDETRGTQIASLGKQAARAFQQNGNWVASHVESPIFIQG